MGHVACMSQLKEKHRYPGRDDFVGAGHARDITTMISGVSGIARGQGPLLQSLTVGRDASCVEI